MERRNRYPGAARGSAGRSCFWVDPAPAPAAANDSDSERRDPLLVPPPQVRLRDAHISDRRADPFPSLLGKVSPKATDGVWRAGIRR